MRPFSSSYPAIVLSCGDISSMKKILLAISIVCLAFGTKAQLRLSVLDSSQLMCSFKPGDYIFMKLQNEKTVRFGTITDIGETFLVIKNDTLSFEKITHLSPPNFIVAPPYFIATGWSVIGRIVSLGFSSATFLAFAASNSPEYFYTYGLGVVALFVALGESIHFIANQAHNGYFKIASYKIAEVRLEISPI